MGNYGGATVTQGVSDSWLIFVVIPIAIHESLKLREGEREGLGGEGHGHNDRLTWRLPAARDDATLDVAALERTTDSPVHRLVRRVQHQPYKRYRNPVSFTLP